MRFLGNTGIKVSEICFGTMGFGGPQASQNFGGIGQKEADTLVNVAIDAGINFFDTADVYALGLSEEILGKALEAKRKNVVLSTKAFMPMGPGPNDRGLSRLHLIEACNASLKRLATDYIDLYLLHLFDCDTPLEETLGTLNDLVHQGKVRYIGCCNFSGWQLMKALAISDKHGWERFVALQANYSLVARELEYELVPLCLDQGLGILTYSSLSGGFLTGQYRRGQPKPEGTHFFGFDEEKGYDILEEVDRIAEANNVTVSQVALNYLLRKPGVTSLLSGMRAPEEINDNIKATEWKMTEEEVARLDKVSEIAPVYPYWILPTNWGRWPGFTPP
jgi:aryl-alcohol dehydrogenase-like predicted oxidoreductase